MNSAGMLSSSVLGPILIGMLAGIPHLHATPSVEPAEPPFNIVLITNIILLVGGVIFTFRKKKQCWTPAVFLEAGLWIMVPGRILFDTTFVDRQSRHMFPFGFLVAVVYTGSGAIVGSMIGYFTRKLFRKAPPVVTSSPGLKDKDAPSGAHR